MKKRLLMITPGPVMSIDREKLLYLSKYFDGTFITTSMNKNIIYTKKVGNFNYECMRYYRNKRFITNIKFFYFAIKFSLKAKKNCEYFDLITTYDPLKSGLIGMICSKILRTKFAPEIAGTYTSKFNYIDEKPWKAMIKLFCYSSIMYLVIYNSDGIKHQYKDQLKKFNKILKDKKTTYFPNLVKTKKFYNIKEEKIILIVGFPFYRKGIDIAINAFKLIANDHSDWKLKILGWFPDKTILFKYIDNHPQIQYVPPVDHADMPKHIGSCSIFITPSRSEGVPRVLIEAMAAGKARIGTNIDGIPEVINNNVDGLLFEINNYYELSEKLKYLIVNEKIRKNLAKNSLLTVNEFSPNKYWEKLIKFYNSLIY